VTRMLVRIVDAREAAQAAAAGVDAIELRIPGMRIPDLVGARAVRAAFPGRLRLSFEGLSLAPAMVETATSVRADEIALALDTAPAAVPVIDARTPPGVTVVALLMAAPDSLDAIQRVRSRVGAVMLEAGPAARIFDRSGIAQLDAFAAACRASGLPFGFSGGLEAPDVARLLLLAPDVLGFETAVRGDHRAEAPLDAAALDAIRALIPRVGSPLSTPTLHTRPVIDRIFVRDFVVPLSIGAYQAERGGDQRVRFSVEAEIARDPKPPCDMRDVFSYDVIIETIRVLGQRDHVTFVETLAEEIAAALLGHAELQSVTVKVEKLDVIDGAVGIEIHRRRRT